MIFQENSGTGDSSTPKEGSLTRSYMKSFRNGMFLKNLHCLEGSKSRGVDETLSTASAMMELKKRNDDDFENEFELEKEREVKEL
jgi:hypothetical protein